MIGMNPPAQKLKLAQNVLVSRCMSESSWNSARSRMRNFQKGIKITQAALYSEVTKSERKKGYKSVCSEQGTSSTHMVATKFLNTIARFPGNDGEDSDARQAYTQILLKETARLLCMGITPETWIRLPPSKCPKEWNGVKNPVCPLLVNLYGHLLAGLLWDKACQEKIMACAFGMCL